MAVALDINAAGITDERVAVLIPSRMRLGSEWLDIVIRNLSSRGLMAECDAPPRNGTYVEIRRGSRIIIGRVIWNRDRLFGVQSQDRLPVQALIDEPRMTRRAQVAVAGGASAERRAVARPSLETQAERSRLLGMAFQNAAMAAAVVVAALVAGSCVYDALSAPMRAATAAMAPGGTLVAAR